MDKPAPIVAEKVTKPIQLLAAWLAGLVLVNGTFLAAAKVISQPYWLPAVLVIAAVVNVFVFLACMFILQTKFRAQLQEDSYYSQFLRDASTGEKVSWAVALSDLKSELGSMSARHMQLASILEVLVSTEGKVQGSGGDTTHDDTPGGTTPQEIQVTAKLVEGNVSAVTSDPRLSTRTVRQTRDTLSLQQRSQQSIWVNDLMPVYRSVVKDLLSIGLKVDRTFGSTSEDKNVPDPLIVTIGEMASMEAVHQILPLAMRRGFSGVAFTRSRSLKSAILLGAYSYEVANVEPIDIESVVDLVELPTVTWEDLATLYPSAVVQSAYD